MPRSLQRLATTRSGTFHLGNRFAHAILRLAPGLGGAGGGHALVRTGDPRASAGADVAWDLDAVHDAAAALRLPSPAPTPSA